MHAQDTTHPYADIPIEVGSRQDYSRILSSQFQSQRSHVVCGGEGDLATDFLRSDKGNVLDFRGFCKNLCLSRQTTDDLDSIEHAFSSKRNTQQTCMSSGLNLQAFKHSLMAPTNHRVDQMTCSEHFNTMAFPANKAAMIGDHELCNAEARG